MTRIYLDHAATTPMRPEAIAAVTEGMQRWANPSSPHAEGRAARAALEDARARIKVALGWDGELIFTSGASEAIALAMTRAKVDRRVISAVEHDSVFRAAPDADVLRIHEGQVDEDALRSAVTGDGRPLVAVQHLNSETGTLMLPFGRNPLAVIVRESGGLFFSDCSQSAGKIPLPDADMIVVSAHKLGGPPGLGALLVRDWSMLEPTGGQEQGYRGGTENLPGVLGFAAALEASGGIEDWPVTIGDMFDAKHRLWRTGDVVAPGLQCANILAVAMPGMSAAAQLIRFDAMGFAVSAGSACSSGTLKKSRALDAFRVDDDLAARTIRVSFGWNTTPDELARFLDAWESIAATAAKAA